MPIPIRQRRDTAANWTLANKVILQGQMCIETDTGQYKIGSGTLHWVDLPYAGLRGPAGIDGTDGTNGTDGVDGNTILYGGTAPANGTGIDGNFYIDVTTHIFYGPKTAGIWPAGSSLIGPAGIDGTNGTNGVNGTNGSNGTNGIDGSWVGNIDGGRADTNFGGTNNIDGGHA